MNIRLVAVLTLVLSLLISATGLWIAQAGAGQVSGELTGGIRILRLASLKDDVRFTVYRGDYVKFVADPARDGAVLSIPTLGVTARLSSEPETADYHKMKKTGRFPFTVGQTRGVLEVIDYRGHGYREVTSLGAADLIRSENPLVLDVRTRQEYARGHLPGSVLIPVQELAQRLGELSGERNRQVLIYCATGNRSTVAARILLDAGFDRVVNMRDGIVGWGQNRLPVVR